MKATICGIECEMPDEGATVTVWFDQGDTRVYVDGIRQS